LSSTQRITFFGRMMREKLLRSISVVQFTCPPGNTPRLPALVAGWRDELPGPATGDETAASRLIQRPDLPGRRRAQPDEGAAFTLSGIGQSLHRRQAFARGQIVYDALDQTGKGAG